MISQRNGTPRCRICSHASIRYSNPLNATSRPTLRIWTGPVGLNGCGGAQKISEIHSVIDTVNLVGCSRAALRHQAAAVFGFHGDELGRVADLAEEIVVAEIGHEILTVRGDAERDIGHRFQEKRGMRRAVREMDVEMVDLVSREKLGEIGGVPRAGRGLDRAAIFLVVRSR